MSSKVWTSSVYSGIGAVGSASCLTGFEGPPEKIFMHDWNVVFWKQSFRHSTRVFGAKCDRSSWHNIQIRSIIVCTISKSWGPQFCKRIFQLRFCQQKFGIWSQKQLILWMIYVSISSPRFRLCRSASLWTLDSSRAGADSNLSGMVEMFGCGLVNAKRTIWKPESNFRLRWTDTPSVMLTARHARSDNVRHVPFKIDIFKYKGPTFVSEKKKSINDVQKIQKNYA